MVTNYWKEREDLMGLSTEEKPQDVADGTTFYEVNTANFYIFYGGTWYNQNEIIEEG